MCNIMSVKGPSTMHQVGLIVGGARGHNLLAASCTAGVDHDDSC